MVFLKEFFEKVDFEKKNQQATKSAKLQNYPASKEFTEKLVTPYRFLLKIPLQYTECTRKTCTVLLENAVLNWHMILEFMCSESGEKQKK